jgi:LmbE family N-acetylglucosaminyl deacetylase
MKQQSNRRLMAVLAHPDDETFGMGGTLALYARRGIEVHVICATRGEAGNVPPDLLQGYNDIGALREEELRCAAACLGVTNVHLLGYRDSGMLGSPDNQHPKALAIAPLDEVANRVTTLIRQIRPQVVITFDPHGGYNHPDHIAIHHATLRAFHASGDPSCFPNHLPHYSPQKLYYHVMPQRFVRLAVLLLPLFGKDPHHLGRNADIDITKFSTQSYPIHVRIDYSSVTDAKRKAISCHRSQGRPPSKGIMRLITRMVRNQDTFMQAYPPVSKRFRERDLFAGVSSDPTEP